MWLLLFISYWFVPITWVHGALLQYYFVIISHVLVALDSAWKEWRKDWVERVRIEKCVERSDGERARRKWAERVDCCSSGKLSHL